MYKIVYLPTGEEVYIPTNDHGNPMTIKQVRRLIRSVKGYTVRHIPTNGIYFTTEGEFQDTHPNYNEEFCAKMGRVKILKSDIRVWRQHNESE